MCVFVCVFVLRQAQHRQFSNLIGLAEMGCMLYAFRASRFRTLDFGLVVVAGYVGTVNCFLDIAACSLCVCVCVEW